MEENKKNQVEKPSYEQLEAAALQLQKRMMFAEERLRTIDAVSLRLNWLFKVLDNKDAFQPEFIAKCVIEVEDLLTIDTPEENSEEK